MKRFLLVLIATVCIISASALSFRATKFSTRHFTSSGWANWESTTSDVFISLSDDVFIMYSVKPQLYVLTNSTNPYIDSDGDHILKFTFTDQDGDQGILDVIYRVRGKLWQIYIRYDFIEWVYDVIPINE